MKPSNTIPKTVKKDNPCQYKRSVYFSDDFLLVADHMMKYATSAPRPIPYAINLAASMCNFLQKDFFAFQMEDARSFFEHESKRLAPATLKNHGKVLFFIQEYILNNSNAIGVHSKIAESIPYEQLYTQTPKYTRNINHQMIGKKFHKLTVKSKDTSKTLYSKSAWVCECECGARILATTYQLTHDLKTDCGDRKKHAFERSNDLSGQTIGCFKILKKSAVRVNGFAAYDCKCIFCGQIKPIRTAQITRQELNSCGCRKNPRKKTSLRS